MIDNPERLWCARINAHENQIIRCHETTGPTDWEGYEPSLDAPVQEYVRADVAAAETTALRRERDALREHLRTVLRAFEEETSAGDGIREEHAPGYEAAKAAAAKGVG